jgi:hypothetical protein
MTKDLRLLRELGEDRRPPADEPPAGMRQRVLSQVPPARRRARPRLLARARPRPSWSVGALGAAAVAVAVLAVPTLDNAVDAPPADPGTATDGATDPATDAATILRLAGQRLRAVADASPPRPDQFLFVESVTANAYTVTKTNPSGKDPLVETVVPEPELSQLWWSVDGSRDGRLRTRPADSPDATWTDRRLPHGRGCTAQAGAAGDCLPGPAHLPGLPTDPDAMFRYLHTPAEDDAVWAGQLDEDGQALGRALHAIEVSQPTPTVQAAAFEALSRIPGMVAVPEATDITGRRGVGVRRTDGSSQVELVFDRTTHEYLGLNVRKLRESGALPADGVTRRGPEVPYYSRRSALRRSAYVDQVGQLP